MKCPGKEKEKSKVGFSFLLERLKQHNYYLKQLMNKHLGLALLNTEERLLAPSQFKENKDKITQNIWIGTTACK